MYHVLMKAGKEVRIGPEVGRGGEGAVHALDGLPDRVAKLYECPPDQRKIRKLLAMVEAAAPALLRIAAWPTDLLSDKNGRVTGFIMPRIVARRDIHELYSPKSRADAFPEADFRFLTHVAANIARAFAVVHDHGHVIGDVNHGNLLIGADGTVMLIDCDSFQIGSGASLYTCDVGVPLFTPPELQGCGFRSLVRTQNHDCFGLAVLLFHLLYMGRHPFAGRYAGPGEMTIERAIAEYRFAYGSRRADYAMDKPPGTIPLETMGSLIATQFTGSFDRLGASRKRPDAKTWVASLSALKENLRVCSVAKAHQFPAELVSCPWCVIEKQTGARLFGQRIITIGAAGGIDVGELWRAISAIPSPDADPPLPSAGRWQPPPGMEFPSSTPKVIRQISSGTLACAALVACSAWAEDGGVMVALVIFVIAYGIWPRVSPTVHAELERALATAKADWESVLGRWQREASRVVFAEKVKALEKARAELINLPSERQRRMVRLQTEREKKQRERYLDRFRIDRAKIRGIGSGRTTMLASYGIETAADVDRRKIRQISGFGDGLTNELVAWRRAHELNFRFNPSEPVDPRDVQAMDRELEVRRQHLLAMMRQGPDTLRRANAEIAAARGRLYPLLQRSWSSLQLAKARRDAV